MKNIPYAKPHIDSSDMEAVHKVLQTDFLTQGPKVGEFEKALAKYIGAKFVVAVNNGTSALHLAYIAAGLQKGDEVITTPNTFVATSNMLLAIGAKPVFCDIRMDTYNIDEKKIERLINKKTRGIVPVHFAGQPCDMDAIFKISKKYNLKVIEDAAHALGASYRGKKIGNLKSDAVCFSFHAIKPITTGEGGAIATNDQKIYKKLLLLRSHGITKNAEGVNVMEELGYNYRLTDIQCALGISQLKRLNSFLAKRRDIVSIYKKGLAGLKDIVLPVELKGNNSGWHIFVILAKNEKTKKDLAAFLLANNIGVNYHYPPVFSHPYYKRLGFRNIHAPHSIEYFSRCLTLPLHTRMTKIEAKYIVSKIKSFYANKKYS